MYGFLVTWLGILQVFVAMERWRPCLILPSLMVILGDGVKGSQRLVDNTTGFPCSLPRASRELLSYVAGELPY